MVHHGIAASDRDALRASSACFCSAASTALPSKLQNGDKNQGTKMSNQLKSDLNKTLLSSCGVPPIYSNRSINYCEAVLTLKIGSAVGFIGCEISARILAHHELWIGTIWLSLVELQTQIIGSTRQKAFWNTALPDPLIH